MDGGVAHGENEGGQGQTLQPDAPLPGLRDQARHAGDNVSGPGPVKVSHRRSGARCQTIYFVVELLGRLSLLHLVIPFSVY